jgi:1-acyl-sn-glycerol-3-phosphate acyltransferase
MRWSSPVILIRSALFNVLFYANLSVLLLATVPMFLMPPRAVVGMAKVWGRTSLWLLRVVCNTKVDFRGLEKIPPGPLMVAAKHQSIWETFALLALFDDPVFIIKRELMWIPFFGWCTWKGGMIPIDRSAGSQALLAMTRRARDTIHGGRQLIIFPEGTRRPAGGAAKYKFGVSHLYAGIQVPCLPVALNSGLFWPRRSFLRLPGTIVVEFLELIPPGMEKQAFFNAMQTQIETATARLIADGERELLQQGIKPPTEAAAAERPAV